MDHEPILNPDKLDETGCLVLVGMAGAGKTTVGKLLAGKLGWAHLDTDQLIEAYYGSPLQDIFDAFGLERFIQLEGNIVQMLNAKRAVISTGGSVIYTEQGMSRLSSLGPVVHLDLSFEQLEKRLTIAGRGLCIAKGQTVKDLFEERLPLYRNVADLTVETGGIPPEESVRNILNWLAS